MSQNSSNQRKAHTRALARWVTRLVRFFFVSAIGAGLLANPLQGVEVGTDRVSGVSDGITDVLRFDGAEGFGRGSELVTLENPANLGEKPMELTDALQVSLPHVLGLPVIGALDVGSPEVDKGGEIAPSGLGLSTGGADRGDDGSGSSAAKERADNSYGLWSHCLVGGLGGVCGSFLVLLFQGYFSAERKSGGTP